MSSRHAQDLAAVDAVTTARAALAAFDKKNAPSLYAIVEGSYRNPATVERRAALVSALVSALHAEQAGIENAQSAAKFCSACGRNLRTWARSTERPDLCFNCRTTHPPHTGARS